MFFVEVEGSKRAAVRLSAAIDLTQIHVAISQVSCLAVEQLGVTQYLLEYMAVPAFMSHEEMLLTCVNNQTRCLRACDVDQCPRHGRTRICMPRQRIGAITERDR